MSGLSDPANGTEVAVVGGGITGLVAARQLAGSGCRVSLLESSDDLGGQIRTVLFGGHAVDVGAEALHMAGPHVERLIDDLGLRDDLVVANSGSAWIWTRRGLRRMPAGMGPAGPTRLAPVVRSGVLSAVGIARAALEPLVPGGVMGEDVGVGEFLAKRFGRQVSDRLVDPVLGSLHAGEIDRLSLRAALPHVATQAEQHRSLLLAHRHRRGAAAPSFVSFRGGLRRLTDTLAATPGVEVNTSATVTALRPAPEGVELEAADQSLRRFGAAVIATPARAASVLVGDAWPAASVELSGLRAASVATAVVAYPRRLVEKAPAMAANGLLVPSSAGRFLKAATFLTSKWPHLDDPDRFLVRLSAGRVGSEQLTGMDDETIVTELHRDLADMCGLDVEPLEWHLERWPTTLARLEVGHLDRMARVRAAIANPRVVLAGAAVDGLGIATCVASGQRAAAAVEQNWRTLEMRP